MKKLLTPSLACAILALAGCASVKVLRVIDGQPQPEGIPFYLPRPYVQVYEPFVISSQVYLAAGRLAPDGQYLLVDNVQGTLGGSLASDLSKSAVLQFPAATVPFTTSPPVIASGPQLGDVSAQAPAVAASAPATAASAPATVASAPKPAASVPVTSSSPTVGQFNTSVTQSAVPFPATLGRRFFDVVWMPDFDEKYVVQGQPGLGNANIGITMVQGWGLYGLDARVDNSAIVRPLLDFYSTGLDALSKLAKSKILPASALSGAPQLGDDSKPAETVKNLAPGTPVSVKITKVLVAAPGLYPVLKPREVKTGDDMAGRGTVNAQILIPQRPYTNIAFNVYEVLVVEATRPTGDSPMNLQRYFDAEAQNKATSAADASDKGGATKLDTDKFMATVNALLKGEKGSDGGFWVISDAKAGTKELSVTATLTNGKKKPAKYATTATLQQLLSIQSKVYAATDVKITEK